MLKEIAIITITVTNLSQVETSWKEQFEYRVRDSGTVSTELAEYWGAEAMAGHDYLIMSPKNEAPVYIRFVADDAVADYVPMTSQGWNATEMLVTDPDAIAMNMEGSLFDVVGSPKDLWPAPDAPRAMQAIGPGGELLYLTRNNQAAGALGLDDSMPQTERAFIMVLGGASMGDMTEFYGGQLELQVDPPMPFMISMISRANALDPETTYPLTIAYTAPGYLIEMDELPETIGPREVAAGHLPPGIAMVGFNSDGITADIEWVAEPRAIEDFPYKGRKAGIIKGPVGELIEVILQE